MDNVTKTFRNKLGRLPQRTCGPPECQNHLSETFHKNKDWMVPSDGMGYSCTSNVSDIFTSIQSLQKIAFGFAFMFHSDSFLSAVRHKSLFVRTFLLTKDNLSYCSASCKSVCILHVFLCVCECERVCVRVCVRTTQLSIDMAEMICSTLYANFCF